MDLAKQKCEACTIDAPLVDKKSFSELLKELDGWEIIYENINILSKTYSFDSYEDSVKFATDIAKLAEDAITIAGTSTQLGGSITAAASISWAPLSGRTAQHRPGSGLDLRWHSDAHLRYGRCRA